MEAAPRAEQRFLERVVGVLDRPEHPVAVRVQVTAMRRDEAAERVGVAGTRRVQVVVRLGLDARGATFHPRQPTDERGVLRRAWALPSRSSLRQAGAMRASKRPTSRLSLWSENSVLSIGSKGSVLSIGSVGSVLSIGSVGSFASVLSIGSAGSIGSALSALSKWSLMSFRAVRGMMCVRTMSFGVDPTVLMGADHRKERR